MMFGMLFALAAAQSAGGVVVEDTPQIGIATRHAEVNLVWDPPWDPQKMTDDAKLELGML